MATGAIPVDLQVYSPPKTLSTPFEITQHDVIGYNQAYNCIYHTRFSGSAYFKHVCIIICYIETIILKQTFYFYPLSLLSQYSSTMSKTPSSEPVNGTNPTTEHTAQYTNQYLVGGVASMAPITQIDNENRAYAHPVGTNLTPNRLPPAEIFILHVS